LQPFQGIDDTGDPHHRFLMFRRVGMAQYAQVRLCWMVVARSSKLALFAAPF
jgi:hypothetical protein